VRIKVALAAVAMALATASSACSHDPEPSPIPTSQPTSTTPTAAPSTAPPPPPLPAAARADTPAGAESFARYWLTALDYAYQTGNTSAFSDLGVCKGCLALANAIEQVYKEGGRFEGGRLDTVSAKTSSHVPDRSAAVILRYRRTSRKTIRGDGHIFDSPAATNLGFLLSLERSHDLWTVAAFPTIK
jgi:hypothetical protein